MACATRTLPTCFTFRAHTICPSAAAGPSCPTRTGQWMQSSVAGWSTSSIRIRAASLSRSAARSDDRERRLGCFANKVPGGSLYAGPHNYKQWLNPAAFAHPPVATQIGQTDIAALGGVHSKPVVLASTIWIHPSSRTSNLLKPSACNSGRKLSTRPTLRNSDNPGSLNTFNNPTGGFSSITTIRGNPRTLQLALKLFY